MHVLAVLATSEVTVVYLRGDFSRMLMLSEHSSFDYLWSSGNGCINPVQSYLVNKDSGLSLPPTLPKGFCTCLMDYIELWRIQKTDFLGTHGDPKLLWPLSLSTSHVMHQLENSQARCLELSEKDKSQHRKSDIYVVPHHLSVLLKMCKNLDALFLSTIKIKWSLCYLTVRI